MRTVFSSGRRAARDLPIRSAARAGARPGQTRVRTKMPPVSARDVAERSSDGAVASAPGRGLSLLRTTRPSPVGRGAPGTLRAGRRRKRLAPTLICRPSDRRGSGNTRSRNMRSRCRCSMCPAIHINSRSWLRSSSTHEPSDPPLRVVFLHLSIGASVARPPNVGTGTEPSGGRRGAPTDLEFTYGTCGEKHKTSGRPP